jgi:hypothetical protein
MVDGGSSDKGGVAGDISMPAALAIVTMSIGRTSGIHACLIINL